MRTTRQSTPMPSLLALVAAFREVGMVVRATAQHLGLPPEAFQLRDRRWIMLNIRNPTLHLGAAALSLALASASAPAAAMTPVAGTLPSPAETTPVYRAQLEVKTCDVKYAGTDDAVSVELNDSSITWLDYARDDFERNTTFTYDLGLKGLATIGDIARLRISKTGSDGLCLSGLKLLINGETIFTYAAPERRWLDNDAGDNRALQFSKWKLQQSEAWLKYTRTVLDYLRWTQGTITHGELVSRIESMVGNAIHGNPLYWGHIHGNAVDVTRKNSRTLHVNLDLARESWWFDPEVDVDFDLELCPNNTFQPRITNHNVDVDSRWYSQVLSIGIVEIAEYFARSEILDGLRRLALPGVALPVCPTVDSQGNISLL